MAVIKTAFPHFEISEPVVRLWHDYVSEIHFDRAKNNLQKYIKANRFPPTIADIMRIEDDVTGHGQLLLQTVERFAELEEWERKAVPPPEHLLKRKAVDV